MLSRAGSSNRGEPGRTRSFRAPVRGLILNENLADMQPQGAIVLENWTPIARGVKVRKGSELHATIGTDPVESLMAYYQGATKKLFAAGGGGIYDVTSPANPMVAPSADVSGQTGDAWVSVNFRTTGGSYMTCVNGADSCSFTMARHGPR